MWYAMVFDGEEWQLIMAPSFDLAYLQGECARSSVEADFIGGW